MKMLLLREKSNGVAAALRISFRLTCQCQPGIHHARDRVVPPVQLDAVERSDLRREGRNTNRRIGRDPSSNRL